MTIGKLSGQCDFGQKGQSYCNQRGQSCVAKRVKVAWLFQESITTTKNGVNTYYKAMVGITLQFKDSQTEEVIASPMFKISDVDVAWIETEESAITSTLRKLSAYVGGYCNRKYPIYGTILESARQSKDKQKEVYIDLGTNLGAYKGLHLTAYTVKTIAGKEAKTQVGKLKIMDVQGEDISFCKIQSGGKEIKNILDKGETIFVKSTE